MKTCPVCALELEDSYLFCPDDGSGLTTPTNGASDNNPPTNVSASSLEPDDETRGAVVLYCRTCAAEYPLTFSACPVHGVQLTRHKLPRFSKREPATIAPADRPKADQSQTTLSKHLTTLRLERPQIERPQQAAARLAPQADREIQESAPRVDGPREAGDSSDSQEAASTYPDFATDVAPDRTERPGFRVAAIATVIALGLFGLVGLYTLVSNLTRRPSPPPVRVASQEAASELPFIPTPPEAQDYEAKQPASAIPTPQEPAEQQAEKRRVDPKPPVASRTIADRKADPQSLPKTPATAKAPSPILSRVSNPPALDSPRNSRGFDARLVRVRGRKSLSGFRYDLTFNLQEQDGRAAHWQRVLITTRSASGKNHSQSIPFTHRLGATGALTFTISVELAGSSEPDWQGRVVCTTLGWDNKGAPLQASFAANVTPW